MHTHWTWKDFSFEGRLDIIQLDQVVLLYFIIFSRFFFLANKSAFLRDLAGKRLRSQTVKLKRFLPTIRSTLAVYLCALSILVWLFSLFKNKKKSLCFRFHKVFVRYVTVQLRVRRFACVCFFFSKIIEHFVFYRTYVVFIFSIYGLVAEETTCQHTGCRVQRTLRGPDKHQKSLSTVYGQTVS